MRLCGCQITCGDDNDFDGPGICKSLPHAPEPPLVEVVLVPRRGWRAAPVRSNDR